MIGVLPPYLHAATGGFFLDVQVQPGAKTTGIVGRHGDRLKIRISSPPEDGRANRELCACLAKLCGLRKTDVEVTSGASSRSKRLFLAGNDAIAATIIQADVTE